MTKFRLKRALKLSKWSFHLVLPKNLFAMPFFSVSKESAVLERVMAKVPDFGF